MSAVNEVSQVEKDKVEKMPRTKKLEVETADLRRNLEDLTKFIYKRLQTPDVKAPDNIYDTQVYQLFTERLFSFEGVHFCVEPDVGLGFAQIFIHSDDEENFYQREENMILYSVNGIVIYKQPIGFAMDVIAKAKKEKKEEEIVILGLLDTWPDESDEEEESGDEEDEEKEEDEEVVEKMAEEQKEEENVDKLAEEEQVEKNENEIKIKDIHNLEQDNDDWIGSLPGFYKMSVECNNHAVEDAGEMVIVSLEDCMEKTNNLQSDVKAMADQLAKLTNAVDTLKDQKKKEETDDNSDKKHDDVPEGYYYFEDKFDNLDNVEVAAISNLGDDKEDYGIQLFSEFRNYCDEDDVFIYSINGVKIHNKPVEDGLKMLKELKKEGKSVEFGLFERERGVCKEEQWKKCISIILVGHLCFIFYVVFVNTRRV